MRGKKWLVALAILVLLGAGMWLWWRKPESSLKKVVSKKAEKLKPDLKVASLNITDIDAHAIQATSKVTLTNNLPIEVKTSRLEYEIYMDSAKIIEDTYSKPIVIQSSGTTNITLPMELQLDKMAAVLKRYDQRKTDSADYTVKASFRVDVPIAGERDFTMHFTKRLPALRLLKVKMQDIDLGKLGLKETGLNMKVKVENPNVFPIKLKDGYYKMGIDDDKMMEGTMEPLVIIPAHGSEDIEMHVDMKTMKLPKMGWKMLFDKKDTRFKMQFNCKLVSENGMLNNSKMAMKMQGTLKELKDAAKEVKEEVAVVNSNKK